MTDTDIRSKVLENDIIFIPFSVVSPKLDQGVPPSPILPLVPYNHFHSWELQIDWDWPPSSLKNAQLELCVCVKLNFYNSTTADDFYFLKIKSKRLVTRSDWIWDLTLAAFLRASSCSFLWKKFRQKKAWQPLGSLRSSLLRGVIESPRSPPHSSEILAVSKSKSWPVHLYTKSWAGLRDVCIFLDAFPYDDDGLNQRDF